MARDGGRVDITRRGEPAVSIVRSSEVGRPQGAGRGDASPDLPEAIRVELSFDPGDLVEVIHDLRARIGRPRPTIARQRKRPQ